MERGKEPKEEVQVYTWMDATLRELTELIQEVQPAARRQQARLEFALIYPDRRGRNVLREVRPNNMFIRTGLSPRLLVRHYMFRLVKPRRAAAPRARRGCTCSP